MHSPAEQPATPAAGETPIHVWLRCARVSAGLTASRLSGLLGVSFQFVSGIETGRMALPLARARAWCQATGTHPETLARKLGHAAERQALAAMGAMEGAET